jgi:quercetin dioxygenase-like cupin family protein
MPTTPAQFYQWSVVPTDLVAPGVARQYVSGDRVTVARFTLKKGALVPRHAHENEQITQVLTGALKFMIDGSEVVLRDGDVLQIPSWMEHEVQVLEDTLVIDVFSPLRQDWINKTDDYFRR